MFVRNKTSYEPVLSRGQLSDDVAVLAISVRVIHRIATDGRLARCEPSAPRPHDPPDIRRTLLWRGVSVTAFGHARGPMRPPFLRVVNLRVGAMERRVVVFGPRRWQRSLGGSLTQTEPARFERLAVSWSHAFGGGHDMAPGYLPGTELPHPGGRVVHAMNPSGMGWYRSEQDALGSPLPHVEDPGALIQTWNDAPTPAGFSPCPELLGLRVPLLERKLRAIDMDALARFDTLAPIAAMTFVQQHHAPAPLVLDTLTAGERFVLEGLGEERIELSIPRLPLVVSVRRGRGGTMVAPIVRSVHVDADERTIDIVYAFTHRYAPRAAPHWIEVTAAEEKAA